MAYLRFLRPSAWWRTGQNPIKDVDRSEVIAERWNKPIEIEKAEGTTVIVAGGEQITCNTNMYTDIFAAGVSILRTEIEIRDRISLNDILIALHSNTIIVEGLDYQSYANKRIKEIRGKINPKTVAYHPDIKKFTFLKLKILPPTRQKSLREQYGEIITRFLSGETSIRALHSKEIMEKIANDLSYYDEDLFLATTEGLLLLAVMVTSTNFANYWNLPYRFCFCSRYMIGRSMLKYPTPSTLLRNLTAQDIIYYTGAQKT